MERHVLDSIDPLVIGQRLGEARRARRVTQQQAATALGVARTTITAMEQGIRRPRATELVTLAQLYGRQVGELVRPAREGAEPNFIVQFRSARGPSDVIDEEGRDADTQRFEDLCRWYVELEEDLGAPLPRHYPFPYDVSNTPPDRAAEAVAIDERNRLDLGDGPIGDLWGILETDVGLRVFVMEMLNNRIAGMFIYSDDYGGCIAVNANHPEEKRRWSATHEYAHFLTDRFKPEITVLRSYQRVPSSERFADAFARHFLMPGAGLVRRFDSMRRAKDSPITPADILLLSHHYKVSFQAMMWRLEELKLLRSGTLDMLQSQGFVLSKVRKLVGLPAATVERSHLPHRYQMLVAQAYTQGLLSEGQLAQRMVTDRVDALLRVRELTQEDDSSSDGEMHQMQFDLNTTLTGEW
jgi:Zn-dependent peptidase ImmA (M78 family)/DNA-binding XRE family transcriptional regulator